ncbi:MAG: methyltransferase [Candidatus Dactylopiibacterium carminicum]|uniref:Methyltransferase n=1 Tax=Candidatus Dactylopiibacterium carminicum TaxID=857335 RepID=A0A272EVJ8_9RHOO|nr:major capsid protein [Candidatus Dactylopiibacterium carminicum]KAF7600094.1 methyltransferase [Candidatus Dactylopiibacterium carminicum]PAS94076.1 MAG: methyltransferase [Candidatus Dactylopiibacterium carminicum]PAS98161.1 MAG: methyltransferase [Candidatus Dactylopiibacterium carminicum]PAT00096.1 MAG: methyltransferase [Candidatus Dactylopiibacterium carminicum]
MKKQILAVVAGVFSLALTTGAQAAIDVSAVVDEIDGTLTPIGLIGGAVLLVAVAIKAYKWVRRAM